MSLIRLEGNIKFIDILRPNGTTESVSRSLTKDITYEEPDVLLVLKNNATVELPLDEVENPSTPGSTFTTGIALLNYVLGLYGLDPVEEVRTLTISVTGGGTVDPDPGDYLLYDGAEITITATESDPNYYLDAIYDDVTPVSNPYVFNIAGNKTVEARFLEWIKIMDVFGTAPILESGSYYYPDASTSNNKPKLYGWAFEPNPATLVGQIWGLNANIVIDLKTPGIKVEAVVFLASGYTSATIVADSRHQNYGFWIRSANGVYVGCAADSYVVFNSINIPATNTYYRIKIVTDATNITAYRTTPDDVNYTNAISQSIALSSLTGSTYNTSFSAIGGYGTKLNGGIAYLKIDSHEFTFQEGNLSAIVFSQTTTAFGRISPAAFNGFKPYFVKREQFCKTANGYTLLSFRDKATGANNYAVIPYINGVSNISQILLKTALIDSGTYMYSYQEYPNGQFGIGTPISLPVSLLPHDYNNTFFTGGVPNVLMNYQIPTQLNKQFYYNRGNSFVCWDKVTNKTGIYNTVGKPTLSLGDSLSGAWWIYHLPLQLGIVFDSTPIVQDGGRAEQIYTAVVNQVAIDPTYISKQSIIFIICGTHDYNQGKSEVQFTADYGQLIGYLRTNNPNAKIICQALQSAKTYSFNPTGDPNIPNTAGMTLAEMRQIINDTAIANNGYYLNWDEIGLIYPTDYPDGIHTYTHSGGYKISNAITQLLNTIIE